MADQSLVTGVIESWKRMGVFDFILPFILVFAIVYGILERTNLFGPKVGKSVNAIIAFAIAMTTTLTGWFLGFLTGYLPWVSIISIIIITGLMLVAMFVGDFSKISESKWALYIGAGVVAASLAAVLIYISGVFKSVLDIGSFLSGIGLSINDVVGIGLLLGFIIGIIVIGKGSSENKGG